VLEAAGREELVDCAQLAISELVTNALLHARDPITVRVRGTYEHPRVEVTDGSTTPPRVPMPAADEMDDLLTTFGRGLSIVAMCAVTWGAALESDGKFVWFEPADSPHESPSAPEVLTLEEDAQPSAVRPSWVEVQFDNVPVAPLMQSRQHYYGLRRELRLLALAHQDDYPIAAGLSSVFADFEHAFDPAIVDQIERLVRSGAERGYLRTRFNPDCGGLVEQMLAMLDLADDFCRAERLLTLARSPTVRTFQQWYFGEFVRQSRGQQPTPCPELPGVDAEPAW
jgi:hypothetical protein